MSANINSRNGNFLRSQSETVTISRRTKNGTTVLGEPTFSVSTPYVGIAVDLQESSGELYDAKAGLIEAGDARMTIEAAFGATLPTIQNGDKVTFGSQNYMVEHVYAYAFPYPHVACILRRGAAW